MLIFSSTQVQSGFTNASISASNDKNASVIVRELLQNSYDSALEDASKDIAKVKFVIDFIDKNEIPGLENYKEKIRNINDERMTEQEKGIFDTIQNELDKEQIPVLHIIDNGVGFSPKTLVAILSDGLSEKSNPANSGGSYGNGHFSSFNISNLRYVLYGGKTESGKKFCSGHALLKTHQKEGDIKSASGFLLKEDKAILIENDIFLKDEDIPTIVSDVIDNINGSGAVVTILGFNYFGNGGDVNEVTNIISSSIVRNFFVAINEHKLTVEITNSSKTITINQSSLEKIFEDTKDKKVTPSYNTANRFFQLMKSGHAITIETTGGKVRIFYNMSDSNTKLALCRNGMWINDSIPSPLNVGNFINYKPFSALILPQKGSSVSALVRLAEGNLHRDMQLKRFSTIKKKEEFQSALNDIKDFLFNSVEKNDNDFFDVDIPELTVTMIGSVASKQNTKRKAPQIKKVDTKPQPVHGEGNAPIKKENMGGHGGGNKKKRFGNPFDVGRFSSRHDATKQTAILKFAPKKDASNLLLSLRLEDGTDPTCDSYGYGSRLKIKKATYNGSECEIIENDTIDIGKVNKETIGDLQVEYETNLKSNYSIEYEFLNSIAKKELS